MGNYFIDNYLVFRFWGGLYNRFDRGVHPRQSVEDYMRAIQEETQQLEEQLASHKQVKVSSLTSLVMSLVFDRD